MLIHYNRDLGRKMLLNQNQDLASCRNLSLGLAIKAKACKGANQKGSSGVTSHAPRNVGKCEGMNFHTTKGTPTLRVGVMVDFRIFIE
jgi:hypothetical protein